MIALPIIFKYFSWYCVFIFIYINPIRALVSINISYDSDAKIVAGYYKGLNKYSSALDLCFCNFYN